MFYNLDRLTVVKQVAEVIKKAKLRESNFQSQRYNFVSTHWFKHETDLEHIFNILRIKVNISREDVDQDAKQRRIDIIFGMEVMPHIIFFYTTLLDTVFNYDFFIYIDKKVWSNHITFVNSKIHINKLNLSAPIPNTEIKYFKSKDFQVKLLLKLSEENAGKFFRKLDSVNSKELLLFQEEKARAKEFRDYDESCQRVNSPESLSRNDLLDDAFGDGNDSAIGHW